MALVHSEVVPIQSSDDVIKARQRVREEAVTQGLPLVEQTKLVTAASEIARNTLVHGGGGDMRIEVLSQGGRCGIRLIFKDQGPGIPDIAVALRDGFTTVGGLGLGLGGAKRLVNDFEIESEMGKGTTVTLTRWR